MSASQQPPSRTVAVTIDDLPSSSMFDGDIAAVERITRDLLAALRRHRVPAIGFVNEGKLQVHGKLDPKRVALLQQWIDAGMDLGNHSFSHPDLHTTPLDQFQRDVLEGEKITRKLLAAAGRPLKYFRHPFLHTGRSVEIQRDFERFLGEHGYRVAPVTIDNYDYMFAAAYDRTSADRQRIVTTYLDYMESVVAYYERQSAAIVGREIAQTLLLHANALNAATFDQLADRLERRGYRFVSLDDALKDSAYALPSTFTGPGGITWLHRWALTQGKSGAIFAGEPAVPDWIERAVR